ncbi:MAG: hypothetical protein R2705_20775 [Ilumatobacteraceae bacterium]
MSASVAAAADTSTGAVSTRATADHVASTANDLKELVGQFTA